MKIIEKRNKHIKEHITNRCSKCDSLIEIEEEDIIQVEQFSQFDGKWMADGFKCANCGEEQTIKRNR
jgi:predicted RNA-binding Zn-ribbon protein involved in translation (DUF1610 family)